MSNFPKNLHFLPSDTHTYVCVSEDKRCKFFGKFCVRAKWLTPIGKFICIICCMRCQMVEVKLILLRVQLFHYVGTWHWKGVRIRSFHGLNVGKYGTEKLWMQKYFAQCNPFALNSEAVVRKCSVEKVFLKVLQNSQGNTCARGIFLWSFFKVSKNTFFYRTHPVAASVNFRK